ncbi:MAG: DUF1214 domain-containing protein [Phyllobacteriaceae bacterium]|nr:DUF1214 domain-containing protein [Phyllobacteriaceae bacterium]
MRFLLSLLAAMAASLILGLGSAWYMVAAPRTGTVEVGAWRALPTIDAATADPYTRARIARTGEIGMGAGEGLTFVLESDEAGRDLDGACDHRLVGRSPPARLWTLTAIGRDGRPGTTPEGRAHLDNRNLLRGGDGRFEIAVAASARPGNWLPTPKGAYVLMLRLYDTPVTLASDRMPEMPTLERGACR